MLLLATGGEPPYHQAFPADATRLVELGRGLTVLRAHRELGPIREFFRRNMAEHRARELALTLTVSRRKWKARRVEVKDLVGSDRGADWRGQDKNDSIDVRKIGWVQLDKELGRARALQRIGAPKKVVDGQRARVRAAYLACGWNDAHAPPPPPPPDFEFWSRPLAADAPEAEQLAWGHAQELVEQGLELCIPPLAEPAGLGGYGTLAHSGTPLIDTAAPAHAGWIDPSWMPVWGRAAELAIVPREGVDSESLEARRARLAELCRGSDAIVWWLDPAV